MNRRRRIGKAAYFEFRSERKSVRLLGMGICRVAGEGTELHDTPNSENDRIGDCTSGWTLVCGATVVVQ